MGEAAERRWRAPAWLRITVWSLLAIVVLYAGWIGYLHIRISLELAAVRKAGHPVTLAELEALSTQIPPEENAAVLYLKAFDAFSDTRKEETSLPVVGFGNMPTQGKPLPSEAMEMARNYLLRNAKMLRLLHEACGLRRCRYPVDMSRPLDAGWPLPWMVSNVARVLALQTLIDCEDGRCVDGCLGLEAMFRLARSFSEPPDRYGHRTRCQIECMAVRTLERVISRREIAETQLEQIHGWLNDEGTDDTLSQILAAERVRGCWILDNPRASLRWFRDDMHCSLSGFGEFALQVPILSVPGVIETAKLHFLVEARRAEEFARQPFPQRTARVPSWWGRPFLHFHGGPRYTAPRFPGSLACESGLWDIMPDNTVHLLAEDTERIACLRTAQVAAAVERFRLRYARLPNRLEEVVPELLQSIPIDPFDASAIRYRKMEKGYRVYSIGADRQDNGGEKARAETTGFDWVFEVTR